MKTKIPLAEVQELISKFYNIKVGLKSAGKGKIKVKYLFNFVISVKEVKDDIVTFRYETKGIVNSFARVIDFLLEKKLEDSAIDWKSETKEVLVFLKKIKALSAFLDVFFLSDLLFTDGSMVVKISTRTTTE